MFYGRRLRGHLPHLPGANDLDIANAQAGADHRKSLMNDLETKPATPLKKLSVDQTVVVQDPHTKYWDTKGRITGIRPTGRSYDVLLNSGKMSTRNRAFLRPIHDSIIEDDNAKQPKPPDYATVLSKPRRSARLAKKWIIEKAKCHGKTFLSAAKFPYTFLHIAYSLHFTHVHHKYTLLSICNTLSYLVKFSKILLKNFKGELLGASN